MWEQVTSLCFLDQASVTVMHYKVDLNKYMGIVEFPGILDKGNYTVMQCKACIYQNYVWLFGHCSLLFMQETFPNSATGDPLLGLKLGIRCFLLKHSLLSQATYIFCGDGQG